MPGWPRTSSRTTTLGVWLVALGSALGPGEALARDLRDPTGILGRIDELVKPDVLAWCRAKGVAYPPEVVVLRIFKREAELEIWARNRGQESVQLLHRTPLCAMDFEPGPKLVEGDGKTPEGFYHADFLYPSPYWWMWIDLDAVDAVGQVGKGSAFRMCLEYPNALDRRRTRAAGKASAGSGICLHGNCVSIGCASMKNRDFLPVYAFARHHDGRASGKLQVHIFPFRFDQVSAGQRAALAAAYAHRGAVSPATLLGWWQNLEQGYDAFNAAPNPLAVSVGENGYVFGARP